MRAASLLRTAAAVLAGALGACESSPAIPSGERLEAAEVEQALEQAQHERLPDLRVGDASCPPQIDARAGERFECTVPIEGIELRFVVRVAEVIAGRARYEFRPTRAVVELSRLAGFVRAQLDPAWRTASVDCGPSRIRVLDVGGLLECRVTNGSETVLVEAIVEDLDGTLTVREVELPG